MRPIPEQWRAAATIRTAVRPGLPCAVAVVSDGSALRMGDRSLAPASLAPLLADDATGIRERSGLTVHAVPLPACGEDLATHLRDLPGDTGAIFLTHTDPTRARAAQRRMHEAGGPPVLTDSDALAITLAAAALTIVNRADPSPAASCVIIAGAATLPELCPLLMAAGIGDISSWNTPDAHAVPLHGLARHATAVIDLLATTRPADHAWPTVITSDDPSYRLLPVAGILRALASHPGATMDIDVSRVCTLALTAATQPGRLVPDMADPTLTDTVAHAALCMLKRRTPSAHDGSPRMKESDIGGT